MSKFKIYSSSAGSGKTFTLAKEYLKLILSEEKPYYFKHILAITFTNDAANEMKERILSSLEQFADIKEFNEKSKAWDMFRAIAAETNIPDEILQFRASKIFHGIIHEYADFSVRTIDSFVNQLVSAFTDDLGLPFNYEIVLDKELVLTEAVERLIEKAGTEEHKELSKILEEFALSKADEGKSWNSLVEDLVSFGGDLLNDQYYPLISKLDDLTTADYRTIHKNIIVYLQWFEKNVIDLATSGIRTIESEGLCVEDFTQKSKGIGGYFYRLRDKFDEKVKENPNSYHTKAIENDEWYSKKGTSAGIAFKIDSIKESLRDTFYQIETFRSEHLPKFYLFNLLKPSFHKLSLLKRIKEEFDEILKSRNQVFISEFNRKILQIILNEPIPFIYERLGEKFNHILIDEFQDTSDIQWTNLMPLIENSLAQNKFNLIVGDAKQSIYRWRGGKMELIVHLYKGDIREILESNQWVSETQIEQYLSISPYIEPVSLNTNYRSSEEIVFFNNDFFETIKNHYAPQYPFLPSIYSEDFQQKVAPKSSKGGHVQIDFLDFDNTKLLMLDKIEQIIIDALAEGYELQDIAVLSRKNEHLARVATFLTSKGYEILSRDSLLLNNSGIIKLIVALLKVLNQPQNKLAKYEAIYLFYQYMLHHLPDRATNDEISDIVESEDINLFYDFFHQKGYTFNAFELQQSTLYNLVEKVMQILGLFEHSNEKEYIFRFLDIALDFGTKQSNHLQDFLKYWEDKKSKLSVQSAGEQNAVTVTTIHRSKGLEYPIVIIPYTNWEIMPKHFRNFWGNLEDIDFQELASEKDGKTLKLAASPFAFKGDLLETALKPQYEAELQSYFLENLNMLYVAFTRPTDKLFVIAEKNKRGKLEGISSLLENYLGNKNLFTDEENSYIIHQGVSLKKAKTEKKQENIFEVDKIISQDRGDRLRLRRISEKVFDPETLDKSKDRGNKIHAAFALINSKNDIEEAIQKMIFQGIINENEKKEIQTSIEQVINLPELTPLFSVGLQVENEQEILTPSGKMQRPDRVVIKDDKVFIIDYKTGQASESHQTQIKRYGNLYHQMGYPNIEMLLVYLEENRVVAV